VTPFSEPGVEQIFASYPETVRPRMLALRELVFATAAALPEVGHLQEALKWGEPAYLTPASRSGSTIRMDWKARAPEVCVLYFNCQTTLVDSFRSLLPDAFAYEGKRALLIANTAHLPQAALTACIAAALTYHRSKA